MTKHRHTFTWSPWAHPAGSQIAYRIGSCNCGDVQREEVDLFDTDLEAVTVVDGRFSIVSQTVADALLELDA